MPVPLSDDPSLATGYLDQLVAFRLRRASGLAHQFYRKCFAPDDFAPRQFTVLQLLDDNPGSTLRDLAHTIGVDHSTLVPTIRFVCHRGWVSRKTSEADRRATQLTITSAGRKQLKGLRRTLEDHDRELTARLTRGQREILMEILDLLASAALERMS